MDLCAEQLGISEADQTARNQAVADALKIKDFVATSVLEANL